MVFQFEHVQLDHGRARSGTSRPLRLPDLKASLGRWQAGLADVGWNSLYWNNHDQPRVVSRFGDDGRAPRALGQAARHGPAPAPRDAVRLPGRGARDDERAVRLDRGLPGHRVAQPLHHALAPRRATRRSCSPRCGRRAATTRARRCSGTRARTPASPPARRGSPSTRTTRRSTPRRRAPTRTRCFHHYRRLIALRHDRAGRGARRLHDAARDTRAGLRLHAPPRGHRAARGGQLLGGAGQRRAAAGWEDAELLLANVAEPGPGGALAPWEARIHRRRAA